MDFLGKTIAWILIGIVAMIILMVIARVVALV